MPRGWPSDLWERLIQCAAQLPRETLITFYEDTGAIRATDLSLWTKEQLLGVLDEISHQDAVRFLELFEDSQ